METHGIKVKDKLGYALGDMGGIMTFGLVSSFLNMFYTDVLGISAGKIAVLMLLQGYGMQLTTRFGVHLLIRESLQNTVDSGLTYFGRHFR